VQAERVGLIISQMKEPVNPALFVWFCGEKVEKIAYIVCYRWNFSV
jgi:hypothetical protein